MTADTSMTLTDMALTTDASKKPLASPVDNGHVTHVTDTNGHGTDNRYVKGSDCVTL